MNRFLLPIAFSIALVMGAVPATAESSDAVVGAGHNCFLAGVGQAFVCVPVGGYTIEAQEPGQGMVHSVSRDGTVRAITLDCVSIDRQVQNGSQVDLLWGAGIDAAGARWYVRVRHGEGVDSYLSLFQEDEPGTGPCGHVEGISVRFGFQVARFVFIRA